MNNVKIKPLLGNLLIFLVLAASGNVEFRQIQFINFYVLVFILITTRKYITNDFLKKYFVLFTGLTILFFLQLFVLGSVTYLGIANIYIKIFIAGWVVYINKDLFVYRFLHVMYLLSIISIIFFAIDVISGGIYKILPPLFTLDDRYYYFFYSARIGSRYQYIRNSGMFWEPGVFSNYLIMSLAFVYPLYTSLTQVNKRKVIVVFIALLTTFSTTGYLVISLVYLSKLLLSKRLKFSHIALTIVLLIIAIYIFDSSTFLKEKINDQTEIAMASRGNFSKTRLGSLIFDMHYITKHPIIGNGLFKETRYADHYYLQKTDESIGHGNGFSQFLSSYGLVFSFVFFYLLFLRINNAYDNKKFAFLFVIIFILNLQGEPLMTYAFYWGLIFLNMSFYHHGKKSQINSNYSRL